MDKADQPRCCAALRSRCYIVFDLHVKPCCLTIQFWICLHASSGTITTCGTTIVGLGYIMTTSVLSTVLKAGSAARRSERRRAAQEPSLSSELIECLHTSNFHDPAQGYFPIGRVRQLISPGSVEKELRRCNKEALDEEEDKDALIDRICRQSYKTFATALFCGLESVALLDFMVIFQEKGLTDEHLPAVAEETIRECCCGDVTKAHSFCIQRWKFLAPVKSTTTISRMTASFLSQKT
jgi:hypothetical protein